MAGETRRVAEMASRISEDIFSEFGWKIGDGPTDVNWSCNHPEHAAMKNQHPCDVVFHYEDPYEDRLVYLNTDLKSYAKASIQANSLKLALSSLSRATTCANMSDDWRKKFGSPESYIVNGLLFIYNHDGEYDKEFAALLSMIDDKSMTVPRDRILGVLGPHDIVYLNTVANDIRNLVARQQLPASSRRGFYYPEPILRRVRRNRWPSATIEMLLSPWLMLWHDQIHKTPEGYLIYYRDTGATEDEYKYLFDFIFRHQMLDQESPIRIRISNPHKDAFALFARAKRAYALDFPVPDDVERRLKAVTLVSVPNVVSKFYSDELGMTRD